MEAGLSLEDEDADTRIDRLKSEIVLYQNRCLALEEELVGVGGGGRRRRRRRRRRKRKKRGVLCVSEEVSVWTK